MARKIERDHSALLHHSGVVHDTMILSAVRASGMQEDNLLLTIAACFVEDLRAAPDWSIDIDVAANDVVFRRLSLLILLDRSVLAFAKQFKQSRC